MISFSFVTYYTSVLLCACYRSGDPVTGKRNYTYMDAVRSNLGMLVCMHSDSVQSLFFKYFSDSVLFLISGGIKVTLCGFVQYLNLFGVAIGYTIASSISMM